MPGSKLVSRDRFSGVRRYEFQPVFRAAADGNGEFAVDHVKITSIVLDKQLSISAFHARDMREITDYITVVIVL